MDARALDQRLRLAMILCQQQRGGVGVQQAGVHDVLHPRALRRLDGVGMLSHAVLGVVGGDEEEGGHTGQSQLHLLHVGVVAPLDAHSEPADLREIACEGHDRLDGNAPLELVHHKMTQLATSGADGEERHREEGERCDVTEEEKDEEQG